MRHDLRICCIPSGFSGAARMTGFFAGGNALSEIPLRMVNNMLDNKKQRQ